MKLTILRMAVDTLEASIGGRVRPFMVDALEAAKLQAQEDECPVLAPLNGMDFGIQGQGAAPYRFVLRGEDATIRATKSPKLPGASVRLSALGLAYYEPDRLLDALLSIVAEFLGPDEEPKLSRLDLCVDFQRFDVAGPHGARFVTPANFRPVYPNAEHPETFQFGRGKVVVRVYNKTRELAVSGKTWMSGLWEQNPDYDPAQDVWRFEVQYRREALKELGASAPADALAQLPELLRYGLGWADLRIPCGLSSDRWERHPAWSALAEATGTHTTLNRERAVASIGDLPMIAAAVAGYTVSAGVRLDRFDFDDVWGILGRKVRDRLGDEGNFAASVKRRRLERLGREART